MKRRDFLKFSAAAAIGLGSRSYRLELLDV